MFQELLERVISFQEVSVIYKGVSVIYKLFLEYNESHYIFTSVFEGIIFVLVLHDYVPECLLERKVGH